LFLNFAELAAFHRDFLRSFFFRLGCVCVLRSLSNPTVFTDFPVSKGRSSLDGADAGTAEAQAAFAFSDAPREPEFFTHQNLREFSWKRGKHKTDVRHLVRFRGVGGFSWLFGGFGDSATAKAQQ